MASYFLPSFLSGWELPSISVSSLSSALQRRLLSYLLKRTLGHLVQGGQLDLDQIDSGLGSGKVEIRNVQLDAEAINGLIPDLPVRLQSGCLGCVQIQLPLPNLWSGELSLAVSDIAVQVEVSEALHSPSTRPELQTSLASSFLSAASEILDGDDEGRDLEDSIHQSLLAEEVGLNAHEKEEVEAGSVVSSYVESLLARLKVSLRNVRLNVTAGGSSHTLSMSDVGVESQMNAAETAGLSMADEMTRVITVQGVELLVVPAAAPESRPDVSGSDRSSPSIEEANDVGRTSATDPGSPRLSSGSGTCLDDDVRAGLSASFVSTVASSMYESALEEDERIGDLIESGADKKAKQSPDEQHEAQGTLAGNGLAFSCGTEPIVLRVKARKEKQLASGTARPNLFRIVKTSTSAVVSVGHLAMFALPSQLGSLIELVEILKTSTTSSAAAAKVETKPSLAATRAVKETQLDVELNVRTINILCAYERLEELAEPERRLAIDSIRTFWARPSRFHPELGHVRVKLDGISAAYSVKSAPRLASLPRATLRIADLGIYEHLPTYLSGALDSSIPRVLPLLILDHNLAPRPSEPGTPTRGSGASHPANSDVPIFQGPGIEAVDWRRPLHVHQAQPTPGRTSAGRGARFASSEDRRATSSQALNPYLRTTFGERGWKMRPSHRRSSSSLAGDEQDNVQSPGVFDLTTTLATHDQGQRTTIKIAPIHAFLDVSLVTRILPAVKLVAGALSPTNSDVLAQTVDLSSSTATISAHGLYTSSDKALLGDLGSEEAAARGSLLRVITDAVRLELRVPASQPKHADPSSTLSLHRERALGLETRCGLFVVEAKQFDACLGHDGGEERTRGVHFASTHSRSADRDRTSLGKVSIGQIVAFHKGSGHVTTKAVACIGSIVDSNANLLDQVDALLKPSMTLFGMATDPTRSTSSKSQVDCQLPSMQLCLDKEVVDSIQFLADDLTQWPSIWAAMHLEDSDDLDREGLKILGSRFFGTRAGLSVISSSTDSTATVRKTASSPALTLAVSEATLHLKFPTSQSRRAKEAIDAARSLRLRASEVACRLESDRSPNTSQIVASVLTFTIDADADADAEERSAGPEYLIARTTEPGLTRTARPMVSLTVESYSEPGTSYRESKIDVALSYLTITPPMGTSLLEDLKALAKAPEGVFEHVEPNEVTRLSLKVRDCSFLVSVRGHDGKAALSLGDVSVKTKITSHAPKTTVKLAAADINLFAIERLLPSEAAAVAAAARSARSAAEHWHVQRFARILALSEGKAGVTLNTLTRPDVDVKVTKLRSKLYLCTDTLPVLSGLAAAVSVALGSVAAADGPGADIPSPDGGLNEDLVEPTRAHVETRLDVLGGLDEDAFRRALPMDSVADLVNDDVPSDPSFLGQTTRYHPEIVETLLDGSDFLGGDSVASLSIAPTEPGNVVFADEDVTIRMLDPNGIRPVSEYFTDPELAARSRSSFDSSASSVRVRMFNLDFSVRLHSGYDWLATRQAIEEEAKRVRRRLQKIKQLLAEGQTPDDSVEAATSDLLGSVHFDLGQDPAEMDPSDMIKAMDEGLGDHSETSSVSDAGTWQPVSGLGGGGRSSFSPHSGATSSGTRNKLHRSRRSMIDFNFHGVEAEFDLLDTVERHLSSRLSLTANTFEIIDNIKTSTWHAFLTRMKVKEAAFRRDSEARMVRIEVLKLRDRQNLDGQGDEEVRVRAKIEPLRLHVDQDALDFLKRFFAFKLPNAVKAEVEPSSQPEKPFIQHAEIYPVKLKLDYKPKRVDYNLLKQGKTIELMNFFHFEGAEMTLRHVTLRGIDGWPRLFDSLNDIWTPDVKANQLADVLSGVAPIRTLVNVGAGVADLVLLPIEQYNKDKRIVRGVQRGATSFAKTTALEAVKLGARLATGTQVILEQAEHMLGGRMTRPLRAEAIAPSRTVRPLPADGRRASSSSSSSLDQSLDDLDLAASSSLYPTSLDDSDTYHDQISRYANQPEDMRDALSQAYAGLSKGLTSAAQTILAVPMEVYEGGTAGAPDEAGGPGGGGGVARPVVKAVPIAVLRGARGATEAFAKTLMGVQAQLGDNGSGHEGKYKRAAADRRGGGGGGRAR